MKKAFAYLRTSSATNAGVDKDSGKRQRAAIDTFARRAGYSIAAEFYDEAVSGADPVDARAGFTAMLAAIAGNGTKTIIVETANRFARDLFVQLTGHRMLRKLGVELIAADSPDAFIEDTPTAALIRNVLGAVSEFEKASLVAKLKGARDRKRRETGKCGGRRAHSELSPDAVALAKKLRRKGKTLRAISAELAVAGHVNRNGRPYHSKSVLSMCTTPGRAG